LPNNLIINKTGTLESIMKNLGYNCNMYTITNLEQKFDIKFIVIELYTFDTPKPFVLYNDVSDSKPKAYSDKLSKLYSLRAKNTQNPLEYHPFELVNSETISDVKEKMFAYSDVRSESSKHGVNSANDGIDQIISVKNVQPTTSINCLSISQPQNDNPKFIMLIHISGDDYALIENKKGNSTFQNITKVPNICNILTIFTLINGTKQGNMLLKQYDNDGVIMHKKTILHDEIDNMRKIDLKYQSYTGFYKSARESLHDLKVKITGLVDINDNDKLKLIKEIVTAYNTQMKNLLNSPQVQHYKLQRLVPVFNKGIVTHTILSVNKQNPIQNCDKIVEETDCDARGDCKWNKTTNKCNTRSQACKSVLANQLYKQDDDIRKLLYAKYVIDKFLTQRLVILNMKNLSIMEKDVVAQVASFMDVCLVNLKEIYNKMK